MLNFLSDFQILKLTLLRRAIPSIQKPDYE